MRFIFACGRQNGAEWDRVHTQVTYTKFKRANSVLLLSCHCHICCGDYYQLVCFYQDNPACWRALIITNTEPADSVIRILISDQCNFLQTSMVHRESEDELWFNVSDPVFVPPAPSTGETFSLSDTLFTSKSSHQPQLYQPLLSSLTLYILSSFPRLEEETWGERSDKRAPRLPFTFHTSSIHHSWRKDFHKGYNCASLLISGTSLIPFLASSPPIWDVSRGGEEEMWGEMSRGNRGLTKGDMHGPGPLFKSNVN